MPYAAYAIDPAESQAPIPEAELAALFRLRPGPGWPEARDRIVLSHTRLVLAMARPFRHRGEMADLVKAGQCGLVHAAEKFDPDDPRGASFKTYAIYWIRQAIQRSLARETGTVKLPYHQWKVMLSGKLRRAMEADEAGSEAFRRVRGLMAFRASGTYCDWSVDDDDRKKAEFSSVEWLAARAPAEFGDVEALKRALRELPSREALVLALRFGLGDGVERTLAEVGTIMGVGKERIRQVELRALGRLRASLGRRER